MSTPAKEPEVPFSFFVELVHAIAAIKPRRASEKQPRNTRCVDSPTYKTFKRWAGALHERYVLPSRGTATIFRLLFPEEDVRRKYGMQETRLAQYLTKILGVSSTSHLRGQRLRKWKGEDASGCLGNEVETVMAGSSSIYGSCISMTRLDSLLAELAGTCAFSADATRYVSTTRRSKEVILAELYATLTPSECAVVTQIILKDLRPILYPIPRSASHYTSALLEYKSNAVSMLSKEAAMHAWDPSGRLSLIFRTRANLEEATLAYEGFTNGEEFPRPTVWVPIQIPKCVKGQGPAHTLKTLHGADKLWMETKYDGERAQIHVWLEDDGNPHIRIFSKSGRDSTMDRAGIHTIIYDALGVIQPDVLIDEEDEVPSNATSFKQSIVVEAEMVAYSDLLGRIDEFWRIRSLVGRTAIGVRHKSLPPCLASSQPEAMETQCSLVSNASDDGSRHLALVFFDVLLIDDVSLLSHSYGERRKMLEQVVHSRHGYAMLAERTCVDTSRANAKEMFRRAFSRTIADHQEGVVVKADVAQYAERRFPWVKLKQDYIPGHGDTVDLVLLGASWEKDRARELRVPPTAHTTFYFGALSNGEDLKKHPSRLPHFEVIFTSSYGLDRVHLEELNYMIKSSDPAPYIHAIAADLPYTHRLGPGLHPPTVLLRLPLLTELFGAGFTKSPGALVRLPVLVCPCGVDWLFTQVYELRFPRIAKIFRPSDRPWIDGMSLLEFQQVARVAVGRERHGKAEDDWARAVFRPDEPPSPGVRCPVKRKRTEDMWVERLEAIDARVGARTPRKKPRVEGLFPGQRVASSADQENAELRSFASTSGVPTASASLDQRSAVSRFSSVTNLASSLLPFAALALSPSSQQPDKDPFPPAPLSNPANPSSSLPPERSNDMFRHHSKPQGHHPYPRSEPCISLRPRPAHLVDRSSRTPQSEVQLTIKTPLLGALAESSAGEHTAARAEESGRDIVDSAPPAAKSLTVSQFLRDCVVFLDKSPHAPRPAWRAPSNAVIPTGNSVSTLDGLLFACGLEAGKPACTWAKRGVVFIDESEVGGERLGPTLKEIALRRARATREDSLAPCRPILVLSMKALAHDALAETATVEEWEGRTICRFG
ncbi:hypothetical protein BC628DRAFT_1350625 [Trametes gibbosa]|nr:hypothetical protein BC628DRAFT_1350625 [Trametes gibbosa]